MLKVDKPVSEFYTFDPDADLLGRGAAGTVFRAVRKQYGVSCALKVMPKEAKSPAQAAAEVRCWHKLDHGNVVKLYEALELPTQYCLSMELVTGGDLLDRITKDINYCEHRARELVTQMLGAVQHIHSCGVVHRDLKLENLLLSNPTEEARLKIADFDLSCFDSDGQELMEYIGTPGYMAPEVIRCYDYDKAIVYGRECDLWSVGVILYILLSGTPPFTMSEDPDDHRWMEESLAGHFVFHEDLWHNISKEAMDLVSRLMAVDPRKRLTAAQALQHPWMTKELSREQLTGTIVGLKKFNARRKLKAMLKGVLAVQKFNKVKMLAKLAASVRPSTLELAVSPDGSQHAEAACGSESSSASEEAKLTPKLPVKAACSTPEHSRTKSHASSNDKEPSKHKHHHHHHSKDSKSLAAAVAPQVVAAAPAPQAAQAAPAPQATQSLPACPAQKAPHPPYAAAMASASNTASEATYDTDTEMEKAAAEVELPPPPPGLSVKELAKWETKERARIAKAMREMDKQLKREQKAREKQEKREREKTIRLQKLKDQADRKLREKAEREQRKNGGPAAEPSSPVPISYDDLLGVAGSSSDLASALTTKL